MMVTFVSQCEQNSLKKTRRVLDAFANRIGDNTWQTIITQEGLLTVQKMLRKTASKNTAVSCHWIRSRSRTKLLWVVGNKNKFTSEGIVPVNQSGKKLNLQEKFHLNKHVIALLSKLGGLFHDVGKSTILFQNKLNPNYDGKSYEPYRHEWVSLRIFQAFVNEQDDREWLTRLVNVDHDTESFVLGKLKGLRDGIDPNIKNPFKTLPPLAKLVAWLVLSHHKLPQYPKEGENPPSFENEQLWLTDLLDAYWNSPQCLLSDWTRTNLDENWSFPHGTPFKSALWQTHASIVAKEILKEERCFYKDWFHQQYTMHLSRLSIMLADHYYSSKKKVSLEWQDRNYQAFANTDKNENNQKYLKQKLDEHNIAVGYHAYKIAKVLAQLKDDLPAMAINKELSKNVPHEYKDNFGWQDRAFQMAKSLREESKKYGFLGISMASTGKGKTRANAKIMYGLSEDNHCRFSVALGLRTLTLQTGDALKSDLQLKNDELAVLIGSQAVKELHLQSKELKTSLEESFGSGSAESLIKDDVVIRETLPEYSGIISKWLKHDPKITKLIQAPVLVSTIDYLMPATEGIRSGRQIAPMLRLLTSDLVLDEPDDFSLNDLPALCRLVNWAGMLGSRVLLSTATISPPIAESLFLAYQAGRKHFTQVNGELGVTSKICCAWFDEFKKPYSCFVDDTQNFLTQHASFVERRIHNLIAKTKPIRKAKIVPLNKNKELLPSQLMANKIRESIIELHKQHFVAVNDIKVSIGLVRMANISPMVAITKLLLSIKTPKNYQIHYCIYHSQFPLLQRSKIESQLDKALTRKNQEEWYANSGIQDIIKNTANKNHIFVVLATAVAEVGRDHDYDWAVVEPSSMRSIIQLAGRVQRHRQQIPLTENIHILSKNYKGLKGKTPSYARPGFEGGELIYAKTDLQELDCTKEIQQVNAISRIKVMNKGPRVTSTQKGEKRQFEVFHELEYFSQYLRLIGSKKQKNSASQWWLNDISWCGEIQKIQPFRQSNPTKEYRLNFTRRGKGIWQEKVQKNTLTEFINTVDIAEKSEDVLIGLGNSIWGNFQLGEELKRLSNLFNEAEIDVLNKFSALSLRILDTDSGEQWQCHPNLGIYQKLKKDKYCDE